MAKVDRGGAAGREKFQELCSDERHLMKARRGVKAVEKPMAALQALMNKRDASRTGSAAPKIEGLKDEAAVRVENLQTSIATKIAELGGQENAKVLAQEATGVFWGFARMRANMLQTREDLTVLAETTTRDMRTGLKKNTGALPGMLHAIQQQIQETDRIIEEEARKNPIAFQTHWLLKIRGAKRGFEQNGLVETDALRAQTAAMMENATRKLDENNGVITLIGPTGSGKSVMAKKLAATLSSTGEYEVVSAHPRMMVEDLLQRMGIVANSTPPEEIPGLVAGAKIRFKQENPDMDSKELEQSFAMISTAIIQRESQKVLETKVMLEAVGRAMKNGTAVVIDEFNYLPPETLAGLNEALTGGGGAKKGFAVIFTGNIGAEYTKRARLDPALVNRILSGVVEYDFPPQEIDASFEDSVRTPEDQGNGKPVLSRDIYQVALTQLVNEKGDLLAPPDVLKETWNCVRSFALVQQIAGGKNFRALGMNGPATQGLSAFKFESVFLSFRNLNAVLRAWKDGGYSRSLDWHVFETIIRPTAVLSEKEAAQLFWLFQYGGLFQGDVWKGVVVDPVKWGVSGVNRVKVPERLAPELKAFTPSEVVAAYSGETPPSFDSLVQSQEEVAQRQEDAERERELGRMNQVFNEMQNAFREEPNIEELCTEESGEKA